MLSSARAAITCQRSVAPRRIRRADGRQHGLDRRAGDVAVGYLDELQLTGGAATQQLDGRLGIATADRFGEWPDRGVATGAVLAGQTDHP